LAEFLLYTPDMASSVAGGDRTPAIPADMPEAEAIRLACRGDSRAFERLYKLHSGRVYRLCLRITGNPSESEDFTQEAFLQLFRKIHTFRGESSFSTWLHRLTVNVVLLGIRRRRRPELSLDAKPGTTSTPVQEPSAPDIRLAGLVDRVNLSKAIDQLPDGYKAMFILHDVEGYKHHEIAEILGCSIGNSKSQLFAARLHLRKLLRQTPRPTSAADD
jgi:RNA polymerase sigma-70 factor, ECF subfamily